MPACNSEIGALFDWDGVIIDSHDQHKQSWELLAGELGAELPDGFFRKTFGMRNEGIIPEYLGWADKSDHARVAALGDRKEELYREIILRDGIDPLPGVVSLLDLLFDRGISCAVGSSTPFQNVDTIMDIIGVRDRFQALVCAADVEKGKPEPDVFLKAAERIDRRPANCVVFEDALVGIEAGHRAGSKVIAVATTNSIDQLQAADRAVQSLTEVSVEMIIQLLAQNSHGREN